MIRREWMLIAATLFASTALVAYNAAVHPALIGYDAQDHFKYVETLAAGHLPKPEESGEFFSPPLPYALPALLRALHLASATEVEKISQCLNILLAIALLLLVLKLCERIRPGDALYKCLSLLLLVTIPIFYKAFSQFRAECYVAVLGLLVMLEALDIVRREKLSLRRAIWIGILSGLAALSRQWAIFIILAVVLFGIRAARARPLLARPLVLALAAGGLTALCVCGWFYAHLYQLSGTVEAFNRDAAPALSLHNQPWSFYFGLGDGKLFTSPIRPAFSNQLIPIFYSDTWGDYWCFFLVHGIDPATHQPLAGPELAVLFQNPITLASTNAAQMAAHLGRVNVAGLLPSAIFLFGVLAAAFHRSGEKSNSQLMLTLPLLVVLCSLVGYIWFLDKFPNQEKGDTIKAIYMLQIFPCLAVLGADFLLRVKRSSPALFGTLMIFLSASWIYLASSFVTHCGS